PNYDTSTITDAGAGLVFYGGSGGLSSTPDVTIEGDTVTGLMGFDVAYCQDINGDGIDDFVITAPNTSNGTLTSNGHIQIHFGDSGGVNSTPDKELGGWFDNGDMGSAVGPCGDGNGDGYSDVNAGDMTQLHTYVFYGGVDAPAPKINLDDVEIWSKTGALRGDADIPDFTIELNAYIQAHQGEEDINGDLIVPINVSLGRAGKIKLHSVAILFYKLVKPTSLAATPVAAGSAIELTWDDHTIAGDDITKMAVEMWNGTGWEEVEKIPKNKKSYIVTGLEDGVEYQFRLRSFDGAVQAYSEPSDIAIATPGDSKAPNKVMNVIGTEDRDAMGINLSWDPSDEDVVNYEIWSNKSGEWAVMTNVSAPMIYMIDSDIEDGPWYFYKIRAWDEVNLIGPFSNIAKTKLVDMDGPMTPENFQLHTVASGRALRLTWDLNDDDTVAYSIESNKTGVWKEVALVSKDVSEHTDTNNLEDGVTYWYRLAARDDVMNPSNYTAKISGVPVDETPPMAPRELQSAARSQGEVIRLSWVLNDDDTVQYNVYMYNESISDFNMVAQVLGIYDQFDVTALVNDVTYRFRLKAEDGAGW
ncbi:MAG: fibronectin type III domain-containing protein, partial [Thermoplasmata archaeon]|nr:fibronectin type III domain-containing protein [Thermoplasmata archaeon]